MNLLDTGKFIKEQRKQNNLTQAQLANKIMVSEKTISKWECGNGFPDTNLMLPLCQALNISANELLSGKKLNENEYKQEAENNLVLLNEQKIKTSKFIFTLEIVLGGNIHHCIFGFIIYCTTCPTARICNGIINCNRYFNIFCGHTLLHHYRKRCWFLRM